MKNGSATASKPISILAKKLFQGLSCGICARPSVRSGGAIVSTRTLDEAPGSNSFGAGFLSSTIDLDHGCQIRAGKLAGEHTL
jgi:hypothetical protein